MSQRDYRAMLVACISFGAVATAKALQLAWHLAPCTMCIIQRYAFLAIGVLAVWRALAPARTQRVFQLGCSAMAFVGLAASVRIQWAISVTSTTCGMDKLAEFFNRLPWVATWPELFEATGVCGDPVPPVFGVPFHIWSLILFMLVLGLIWHRHNGVRP